MRLRTLVQKGPAADFPEYPPVRGLELDKSSPMIAPDESLCAH